MKNLKQEKRAGFYWKEGKPYVSVTQILKVLDKPALRWWFGREVFYAMAKNPNLTEQEAMSAPSQTSAKAIERGRTIHSIVEAWEQKGTQITTIPEYENYAKAFYAWVKDYKMELVAHEKTVFSETYGYAGTLDLLTKNNGDIWVIDVKTGKDIYDEAFLQVSAYMRATYEADPKDLKKAIKDWRPFPLVPATRGGVLLLQDTGKYKFAECEDYFDYFLNAKKLWEFQNREMLKKVGYGQD